MLLAVCNHSAQLLLERFNLRQSFLFGFSFRSQLSQLFQTFFVGSICGAELLLNNFIVFQDDP